VLLTKKKFTIKASGNAERVETFFNDWEENLVSERLLFEPL